MAILHYAFIPILVFWILSPTQVTQSQGRLILAPPPYVQYNMFSVDFVSSILQDSGKSSFFYPAQIRKQLQEPNAPHHEAKYAKEMADMHAGFGSDVAIDSTSVVRLLASDGSYWTGQKHTYEFVFSARIVEGANGTSTVFEYTTAWRGPILLYTLHRNYFLPRWFKIRQMEPIDSKGIDLFCRKVEKAWEQYL